MSHTDTRSTRNTLTGLRRSSFTSRGRRVSLTMNRPRPVAHEQSHFAVHYSAWTATKKYRARAEEAQREANRSPSEIERAASEFLPQCTQRSLLGIWLRAEAAQRGGEGCVQPFSCEATRADMPNARRHAAANPYVRPQAHEALAPVFASQGNVRNEASSCGCAVLSLGGSMREWDSGPRRWANGSGSGGGTLVKRSLRPNQKCVDTAIKTDVPQ